MNGEAGLSRTAIVGNNHETIAPLHYFFAVLFCRLFAETLEISRGSHKGDQANGTVSNRDLLSDGSFLSEISSALASRILDWTGGTRVST